jgi:hypothetical protein
MLVRRVLQGRARKCAGSRFPVLAPRARAGSGHQGRATAQGVWASPRHAACSAGSRNLELRASASRFFYFAFTGRRFVILHGYRKKSQKAPRREIEAALRRMDGYVERQK